MSYSLEKFSTFAEEHQYRVLYKLMRAGESVAHFAEVIRDEDFGILVVESDFRDGRETLLAFLEKQLGRSVMDGDILGREEQTDGTRRIQKMPHDVLLHDMRSAHNVGAILRTAECFGFRRAWLSGYTPTPEQSVVQKTTMGVEEHLEWHKAKLDDLLAAHQGQIVALELTENAVNVDEYSYEPDTLFVLGNEKVGVTEQALERADAVVKIPLYGWKNSLNVSNAFAILAHEVRKAQTNEN